MCQSRAQGGRRCAAHTATGSLASGVAADLTSLTRAQATSLFTRIRREAVGANHDVSGRVVVDLLRDHIDRLTPNLHPTRAAMMTARADVASEERIPACVAYSGIRMVTAARAAEREITAQVERHASRTGCTVEESRAEYERLLREAAETRTLAAPTAWVSDFEASHARMPTDRGTLYALHALDTATAIQNCGTCGQFTSDGHSCPPRNSAEEVATTIARAHLRGAEDPASIRDAALRGALVGFRFDPDDEDTERTYVNGHANFSCPDLTAVRNLIDDHPAVSIAVLASAVEFETEHSVFTTTLSGRVTVTSDPDNPFRYRVTAVRATDPSSNRDGSLRCLCDDYQRDYDCEHVRSVVADITARINEPTPNSPDMEDALAEVSDFLIRDRADSLTAQQAARDNHPEPEVSYSEDMAAFQTAYRAAKDRAAAGEAPVPYLTENATGGLGSPDGGRAFGVELEFDFPDEMSGPERREARRAIGQELYDAGLTDSAVMGGYHDAAENGYARTHHRGWSFEMDTTVAGEIVSPIMHDTPETWANVAKVCEIVKRHGGVASVHAGSHVHVGVANYNHTVENHNRLVGTFAEYQDVLYRLSTNPERGTHRGPEWCAPNRASATGYRDVTDARHSNYGHEIGLNLESVTGRHNDHVEFRTWDASLDPAVIQTQIKVSLAVAESAFRDTDRTPGPAETLGAHRRERFAEHGSGRRNLTGEAWAADTASFRRFADQMFTRAVDKEQVTALFAVTRWQRSRGRS